MHIHNTVLFNWLKALGNWRFFALQRDKVTILFIYRREKKAVFFRGGVKTFVILSRFVSNLYWHYVSGVTKCVTKIYFCRGVLIYENFI